MPDADQDKLIAALDLNRLHELAKNADLAENLWAALRLAAERGETGLVEHHARQIAILTRSVLGLVKLLGKEEPNA